MSEFQSATYYDNSHSIDIDAIVNAEIFTNILDICDNTTQISYKNIKNFNVIDIGFAELFDVSDSSIEKESIIPLSSHTIYGSINSNANRDIFDVIETSLSAKNANRVKNYISNDPSHVNISLDEDTLPNFPEEKVSLYTSIASTDTYDNLFSILGKNAYILLSLKNWRMNVESSNPNVNINTISDYIKLSNGESIVDNLLIELGFVVNKESYFNINPSAYDTRSLFQNHFKYCLGLYNFHKNSNNVNNERYLEDNQFKPRVYHLGYQIIKNEVIINQTSKTNILKLGNGEENAYHFLLRITPSDSQLNIKNIDFAS
jgi:hypothetical protein